MSALVKLLARWGCEDPVEAALKLAQQAPPRFPIRACSTYGLFPTTTNDVHLLRLLLKSAVQCSSLTSESIDIWS